MIHQVNKSFQDIYTRILFLFFFSSNHHFYFPAYLVGGFTLSDLLGKPWPQVSYLLPPSTCLYLLSCTGFSIPTARQFSSNVANSRSRAFRYHFFTQEKPPTSMHSVRLEPTELILIGTRTTYYQAIGDAGCLYPVTSRKYDRLSLVI